MQTIQWLKRKNFSMEKFSKYRKMNFFTDVVLVAEGKCLRVHKIMLCAVSSVFSKVFEDNEEQNAFEFANLTFEELAAMIDYIYEGSIKIQPSKVPRFVEVCRHFELTIFFDNGPYPSVNMSKISFADVNQPNKTYATLQTLARTQLHMAAVDKMLQDCSSKPTFCPDADMVARYVRGRKRENVDYDLLRKEHYPPRPDKFESCSRQLNFNN